MWWELAFNPDQIVYCAVMGIGGVNVRTAVGINGALYWVYGVHCTVLYGKSKVN